MINLQVFFDGLFLDLAITYLRLSIFTRDVLLNLTNNNPGGIYTDSINATQSANNNLESIMLAKTSDLGTRAGGVSAKNIARRNLEIYCANHIGWARALFGGKDDPRFIATFPKLTKAFYNVAGPVFEVNIEALISKALLYSSVLGPEFESDLTELYAAYTSADEALGSSKSAVRTDIVTEQMAAEVLSDQLTDVVLLVARNNRKSQTAAKLYFNLDLLYPHTGKEIHKGKIAAHAEAEVCPIDYSHGKRTHIYITGATRLTFGMKLNGVKVGETISLDHGESGNEPFSFYFTNGTSIYVINDTAIEGMYQLDIIA